MGMLVLVLLQLEESVAGEYTTSIFRLAVLNSLYTSPLVLLTVNVIACIMLVVKESKLVYAGYTSLILISNISKIYGWKSVYFLHWLVVLGSLPFLLTSNHKYNRIAMLGILSVLLDEKGIYILLLSWLLVDRVEDWKYGPYLCYLWSHLVWLCEGNRYEYCSVDITRSFVLSEKYSHVLNPLFMGLYMVFPYILPIVLALTHHSR